jgi:hypothetical protein
MTTFPKVRVALATIAALLSYSVSTNVAQARVISAKNGTITMNAGNRTGLQQAFAWDVRCKAVPVALSGKASAGTLLRVDGVFSVLSGRCAGRKVRGFTVVYKAPAGFTGTAKVVYTLKAANNTNYFKFTRLMNIR